jgi:ABC-type dipeptide/oligopeptide/nickel transport system permease component
MFDRRSLPSKTSEVWNQGLSDEIVMGHIVFRKTVLGVFYLLAISFIAFFMSTQMPGDPAEIVANLTREEQAPPELIQRIRQEYGFDKSWIEQYGRWLTRVVLHGDLGYSTRTRLPVVTELNNRLPVTIQLGLVTFLVTMAISFPLGLYAGITKNQIADTIIQAATWVSYSMPVFLVGNILIWLFAVKYHLLPSIGHESWKHFILPVMSLSLHLSGWLIQVIRSSVQEITQRYYILVARAKGLPKGRVIMLHLLKPALLPIATAFLLQLGNLISGSFIVETVFAWNGIGRLLIDSIMARDFPMIQGVVLYVGSILALINVSIDLLYLYLDPSIASRLAGGPSP